MKKKEGKNSKDKIFVEILQTIKSLFKEAKNSTVIIKDKNKKIFELSLLVIIIITMFFPVITVAALMFIVASDYKISMEKK